MCSSSVGMTQAETRDPAVEICGPFRAFAASSSSSLSEPVASPASDGDSILSIPASEDEAIDATHRRREASHLSQVNVQAGATDRKRVKDTYQCESDSACMNCVGAPERQRERLRWHP
jgi:hypothetical protein